MKKNIFIPLFFALTFIGSFTFCSKDPDAESLKKESQVLNPDMVSTDDRNDEDPEGCSSLCFIRINDISHTVSVRNYFTLYKEFKPFWVRSSQSANCGQSTLQVGQWYPITLIQNEQYIFTPEHWLQCNVPANFSYPISLKVANNIFNYNVNSRSQFAFTRQGCAIIPGWVE